MANCSSTHTLFHEMRQLVKQAMLEASEDTWEHLILPDNISKQLRVIGEVNTV